MQVGEHLHQSVNPAVGHTDRRPHEFGRGATIMQFADVIPWIKITPIEKVNIAVHHLPTAFLRRFCLEELKEAQAYRLTIIRNPIRDVYRLRKSLIVIIWHSREIPRLVQSTYP